MMSLAGHSTSAGLFGQPCDSLDVRVVDFERDIVVPEAGDWREVNEEIAPDSPWNKDVLHADRSQRRKCGCSSVLTEFHSG